MVRIRTRIAILASMFLSIAAILSTSASGQNPEGEALPRASIAGPDAKKIHDAYMKFALLWKFEDVDAKDRQKLDQALTDLTAETAKFEKEKKVGSVLADDKSWLKSFADSYTERIRTGKEKSPSGKGTIKEDSVELNLGGELVRFDYAYCLPSAYTPDKSWPVLICVHDKQCPNGKKYIAGIWDDDKESKEIRENFIIVAPTLVDDTIAGPSKLEKGKNTVKKHVTGFDKLRANQLTVPLREIKKRFNCDATRIYIEGVGKGGQLALRFCELYGNAWFAGVVLRQAQPMDFKLLGGLKDKPVLFLYREGGALDSGDAKKFWDDVKQAAEKEGITTFAYSQKPKVDKVTPKMMAEQETEPIKEANKDIWDFLSKQTLNPYPANFRFVTNNSLFKRGAYVSLDKLDIEETRPADCSISVDRASNTIKVVTSNFFGFTLFLNDSIVDLDKPVEVWVNGAVAVKKKVDRLAATMFDDMKKNYITPLRVVTGILQVNVPTGDAASQPESQPADPEKK